MTTTVISHTAVQLALRNQLLTVGGLPTLAAENKKFTPTVGTPYVAEKLVPATQEKLGVSTSGTCYWTGLYVVTYYGVQKAGLTASAMADAILAKFPPASTLTATDGTVVRIRSRPAPFRGEVLSLDGWTACAIKIPYEILA